VTTIARDKGFRGGQQDLPPEIRQRVQERFADVMQVTRVMRRLSERKSDSRATQRPDFDAPRRRKAKQEAIRHPAPGVLLATFGMGAPDQVFTD
jgi:hypothetical protein